MEDSSSCSGKANGEREGIGIKILAESVAFTRRGGEALVREILTREGAKSEDP